MSENNETTTAVANISNNNALSIYLNPDSFKQLWQASKLFASSDIIPATFKGKEANCFIALEMASRMGINPFALMQNLYVLNGKPALESKFTIALINNSNMFVDPLEFETVGGDAGWDKKNSKPMDAGYKVRAFATRKKTGKVCYGPWITWDMVIAEGWVSKTGSKWQTMASVMFMYRAASFFGKLYCPDLTFGMQTAEEMQDVIDITPPKQAKAADIASRFADSEPVVEAAPVAEESKQDQETAPEAPTTDENPELLQQVYAALNDLFETTGEYADDAVDRLTNGKFGCQVALQDAKASALNDLLVSVKKELGQ